MASQGTRVRYGFAFLDAAAARFYVGSASDDGSRANLTALLTQVTMDCAHRPDLVELGLCGNVLPRMAGAGAYVEQ